MMLKRPKLARVPLKRSSKGIQRTSTLKRATGKIRAKKTPEKKLREELWELCKKIIRTTYGNTCYTCEAPNLAGANWHTGHFIPRSVCGAYLRYDLRNLRPQCYRCNISLAGNGSSFYRNLVQNEGQAYVDQLFEDKKIIMKENKSWYVDKIAEYRQKVLELQ
jgi:hypothetical protein